MTLPEITVPELAKRLGLGCSIPRAQALIRTGQIRRRKGERGWVPLTASVDAYLAKLAAQGSGKKRWFQSHGSQSSASHNWHIAPTLDLAAIRAMLGEHSQSQQRHKASGEISKKE